MTKRTGKRSWLIKLGLGILVVALAAEVGLRLYVASGRIDRSELATLFEPSTAEKSFAGEFSVRRLVRPSPFEDLIYELEPGLRGTFESKLFHTSSAGSRGAEHPEEKAEGTVRIVGLGDDHMLGLGVAEGQTYLDLLERELNRTAEGGTRYEVLNFAAPGYNTAMEAASFEHKASRFDPDLVVLHFVGDDGRPPRFLPATSRSVSPSYLYEVARGVLNPSPESDEEGLLWQAGKLSPERQKAMQEKYGYMRGVAGVEAALERLAAQTVDRDIPVVLLMLGDEDRRRVAARQAAEGLGFRVVNAAPHFSEHLAAAGREETREEWRRLFYLPDGRPTPDAHRAYADALVESLNELGI